MKKNKTLIKIIESAIKIFSSYPFEEVAFSQICTHAGISTGSIYNYFKTKEELFKYLLNETNVRLEAIFSEIEGTHTKERLLNFIKINFITTKKEFELIKIYREGQYKYMEYEEKLRQVYIDAIKKIFQREISEIEYLYIISGLRFINVRFNTYNRELDYEYLAELILKGFSLPCFFNENFGREKIFYQLAPFQKDDRRIEFLEIGEKLFGENGYHKTKISDLTKTLNISVGSFYNSYSNKENFLLDIMEQIKKSILFFLKYNASPETSLLERNLEYLYLIAIFFRNTPHRYELLRESEFVSADISDSYFQSLEDLFSLSLTKSSLDQKKIEIISNYFLGLSHYIGIELYFLKKIENLNETFIELSNLIQNGVK